MIQHTFPELPVNDPSIWFFVWMFTLWCVWMVWIYFRWRSAAYPDFKGRKYSVTLGLAELGVIGVFMLGAIPMYLQESHQGKIVILSVYLAIFLLPVMGFGWTEIWKRFKDPHRFLAKYCLGFQVVLLILVLFTPIAGPDGNILLLKLAMLHPFNYISFYFYLLISIILFGIYLLNAGRSNWVTKLSGALVIVNFIVYFSIDLYVENKMSPIGVGFFIMTTFLGLIGMIPQIFWAFNSWKKLESH